jgi:predicted RNA methylase
MSDRPARGLREALARHAPVTDTELDRVFPDELRERSAIHWTPIEVALRVAELLAPARKILDVGAGVGKLCVIGAAVSRAEWWGVEQDVQQVVAARHAAWALDVDATTRFVHGDGTQLSWDDFDGIYFYNPFTTLMLSQAASAFVRYATIQRTLRRVEQRLAALRPGTRVVTYHGFGGKLPAGYARVAREPFGGDAVELWLRDAS